MILANVGHAAFFAGQSGMARRRYVDALDIAVACGFPQMGICALAGLAALASSNNESHKAALLLGCEEGLCEDTGNTRDPNEQRLHDQTLAELRVSLAEADLATAFEDGHAMSLEDAARLANQT